MDHPPLALAGEIGASRNDTSSLAQAHPADEEAGPATEPGLIPVQAPAVHEQDGDEAQSGASATNDAPAVELPAVPSEDSEGGEGDDGGEDSDGEGVGEGDGDDGGDSDGSLEENSDSGGSGGGRKGRRELKSLILPQWSKFVAADESRPRKRVVTDSGLGSAIMPTPYTAAAGYRPKDAPKSTPKTTPRNKHKPASVIKAARSNAPHHRDFAAGSTVEVLDSGVTGTVVEEGSGWVMVRLDGSHASEPKGFRAANLALRQPKAQAAARQAAVRQGSGDQDRSSGESSHEDGEIERAPTDLRVGDVVRSLSGAFRRGTVSAKIQGWTVVRVDDRDVKVRASQLTRLETIAGTAPTDARATANLVAAVAGEVAAIEEGEQKEEERLGLGERGREAADFSTGDVVRFDGGEANVVRTAKGWVMITSSSSSSEVGKRANQLTLVRRNHQAPPLRPAESAAEPDAPVIVEVVRRAKAVERIPEAATVRAPRQVVAPSRFRDSDSDESDAETSAVKAHSTARSKARSTARSKMGPRVKFGDLSPNDVVRTRSNRSDESVAPFNRGVVTSLRKYKEDGWATVRVGKGEHVELVKVRSADLERADGSDDEINENDENDQGGEVNQEEGFQKVPAAGNAPSVSADAAAILAVSAAPKFIPCAFGELSVGQRVLVHAALEATPATVRSLFDECCRCP